MTRLLAALFLIAIVIGAVVYNLHASGRPTAQPVSADPPASAGPPTVMVAPAKHRPLQDTVVLQGVLRADRQAVVSAKMPAAIHSVLVRAGDRVSAGQLLIVLDSRDARSQAAGARAGIDAAEAQYRKAVDGRKARAAEMDAKISEARAGLATALAKQTQAQFAVALNSSSASSDIERAAAGVKQAEAGLRQANSGLAQAEDLVKRLRFLYDHGGVARADLEGAEGQLEIAKAQKDAAVAAMEQARALEKPAADTAPLRKRVSEADVEAARAGVRQAEDGLKSARRARVDALRIADRDIEAAAAQVRQARAGSSLAVSQEAGASLTSPIAGIVAEVSARSGETAQPGMTLATIVSPDSIYLEASVPIEWASAVRGGEPASVTVDSLPGQTLHGRTSRVVPSAAQDSRSLTARIDLDRKPAGVLFPGTMARAEVSTRSGTATLAIPSDALRTEGSLQYVYVARDNRAERRAVTLGRSAGPDVEVRSGVAEGELVIVAPPSSLQPGMAVRPQMR